MRGGDPYRLDLRAVFLLDLGLLGEEAWCISTCRATQKVVAATEKAWFPFTDFWGGLP